MKGNKLILAIILAFLSINLSLRAEDIYYDQRYLLVQSGDSIDVFPIDSETRFDILDSEELVLTRETGQNVIDLKGLEGFGIVTRQEILTSVENVFNQPESQWHIRDLNGLTVRSAQEGPIDFSGLEKGKIYIITIGSETYKYMPL